MGGNGSKEIKKVVDNACAGIGVDTEGNEGRKGIEGVIGIYLALMRIVLLPPSLAVPH